MKPVIFLFCRIAEFQKQLSWLSELIGRAAEGTQVDVNENLNVDERLDELQTNITPQDRCFDMGRSVW